MLSKDQKMFQVKNNQNCNLRDNNCDYFLEKPRTNFLKKSISYSGGKLWNELPTEFKCHLLRDRSV